MKKHIIAVEVTGERIIKNGTNHYVDHDHLFIRVQMSNFTWQYTDFVYPKNEVGLKSALNRAHYIAYNNTNLLMNNGIEIPVFENGYRKETN